MVTKTEARALAAKREALAAHLKNIANPDAASLSRSYGLPVPQVEKMIGARNG